MMHYNTINLLGKKFGRLRVLSLASNKHLKYRLTLWKCKCDCGKMAIISGVNLRKGSTKSCGCLASEMRKTRIGTKNPSYKHGLSKTKKYIRNLFLQKHYGITLKQYNRLYKQQHGKCLICKRKSKFTLHVDHDHKTEKVRGLLCRRCNRLLGLAHDKKEILYECINYLNNSKIKFHICNYVVR